MDQAATRRVDSADAVDSPCLDIEVAIIGSGVRHSKLLVPGRLLGRLPGAEVLTDLALVTQ